MAASNSYFVSDGHGAYVATEHAGSAWDDDGLHFSPVAGLAVHHLEQERARRGPTDKLIGRLSFDILGRLPNDRITFETRLLRPGRTIELWETTVTVQGRAVITMRAWALSAGDTAAVEGGEWPPLPAPETQPHYALNEFWPSGYMNSVKARKVGEPRRGRSTVWVTTELDLIEDETVPQLARYVALIDTANGVAVREHPEDCMFPNVDLTVHLFRQPGGRWNGFDTTVTFGADGLGLTSSVLHDVNGPVGTAQQLLTVRPRG